MRTLLATVSAVVIAVAAVAWAGPPPASAAVKVIDAKKATITIWHSNAAGTAGDWAFQTALASVRPKFPNVTFRVVRQPWYGETHARFQADPVRGPDLFQSPNDQIGTEVRAKLLRDVTSAMKSRAAGLTPQARAGARLSGKYWMVPESTETLALLYRPSRVAKVPATTAELLDAVRGGLKLGVMADSYFSFGFYAAFGGKVIDATYRCVADRTPGVADSLAYLRQLQEAGAKPWRIGEYYLLQNGFTNGELDAVVEGDWAIGDYRKVLAADMAVAPLPAGPIGPSQPMVGTTGWFINAKRVNGQLATRIALALTDKASQTTAMTAVGRIPADSSIALTDPLVAVYARIAAAGIVRPVNRQFEAYWVPFRSAAEKVILDGSDATAEVRTACSAMNATNGR